VEKKEVEIRGFSFLAEIFEERNWPFPLRFQLDQECSAEELARMLDLPLDKIEAVFVNGQAVALDQGRIKPGDRVAFVPPGTPGPYRVILGMVKGAKGETG